MANEFPEELAEICEALRQFRITEADIIKPGGNESEIPKKISAILRDLHWREGQLNAKLIVDEEEVSVDTHKIDYVKGRVAFDVEWNSKDQTFDRDLYAFRTFFDYNKISVGVLLTRSTTLNEVFRKLGSEIMKKYGASTTHMGKLLPRMKSGRSGGCPVLVIGITPNSVDEAEKVETVAEVVDPIAIDDIANIMGDIQPTNTEIKGSN